MAAKTFFRDPAGGGTLRQMAAVFFRDPAGGGTLRDIEKIFYRDAGVLRLVFEKAPAGTAQITDQLVSQTAFDPSDAVAGYRVNANGDIEALRNAGYTTREVWLLSGVAADYEFRAVLDSGDTPAGAALNTWIDASTSPQWSLTETGAGSSMTCVLTVSVRPAGGGATIDTCTVTLYAEVEP